jgi:CRISPR-associated protein Csy2
MSQYVVIPRIEVKGANAQSAWWLVSGVSPLAWVGLIRKLAINMGIPNNHDIKVAILHHDQEMRGDTFYGDFFPWQLRGGNLTVESNGASSDYAGASMSMGLQPVALCNLTATLVIEGMGEVNANELEDHLLGSRLAGGAIQSCCPVKTEVEWSNILTSIDNGFFIKARTDLLATVAPDQRIETLLKCLYTSKLNSQSKDTAVEKSWLVPMNLGYLPITTVTYKRNTRINLPHAYAEPLVGLVEYVSKRSLKDNDLGNLFWGYCKDGPAYIVKHI